MKKYFIILLTTINSIAFGQSRSVSKSIEDDGKSVSIHISGTIDGQTIKYDHTFDLSFLDKSERLALKEKVLDSLDLSFPAAPEPPIPPLFSDDDPEPEVSEESEKVEIGKTEQTESVCDKKQSFSKQIKYNSEGQMYMHYQFVKNGEDFEYERTLNANGKSERERQRIIEETEKEIGFSIDK